MGVKRRPTCKMALVVPVNRCIAAQSGCGRTHGLPKGSFRQRKARLLRVNDGQDNPSPFRSARGGGGYWRGRFGGVGGTYTYVGGKYGVGQFLCVVRSLFAPAMCLQSCVPPRQRRTSVMGT